MLTIKHIEVNGYESIEEVSEIWREPTPGTKSSGRKKNEVQSVWAKKNGDREEAPIQFSDGTLIVMNANGVEISRYEF